MANDVQLQIAAFSSQVSYRVGEDFKLHVAVSGGRRFATQIIRLGWYGGAGGRIVRDIPERPGPSQPACTSPDGFGTVECPWSATVQEPITSDWVSGVYEAVLTTNDHIQAVVPFVVRDGRTSTFVHVSSFNNYAAYNNFPDGFTDGRGRSFYTSPATVRSSFDRPLSFLTGFMQFYRYEPPMVQFLERNGYDVTYAADPDVDAQGAALIRRSSGVIYSSHPEYWTPAQRAATFDAPRTGRDLVFVAANIAHWPVRFEDGADGAPRRRVVGYKDVAADPIVAVDPALRTDRRYHQLPGQAEQFFVGGQYVSGAYVADYAHQPLVVGAGVDHWAMSGSGLTTGETLPGEYAGYEVDSFDPRYGLPSDMTVLMSSPFAGSGINVVQRSVMIEHPGSGFVFNTGSMAWAWGLSPGFGTTPARAATNENPALQRITRNVLDRIATR